MSAISASLRTWLTDNGHAEKSWTDNALFEQAASEAVNDGSLSAVKFNELQGKVSSKDVFGGIRVKKPSERYSNKKSVGLHVKTGQPVIDMGKQVETPSELELHQNGTLIKHVIRKSGANVLWTEHDEATLHEICETQEWAGDIGGEYKYGVPMSKALLDDVTSGGLEATPIAFDSNLIVSPLLSGELYPFVENVELARGRRIEGAAIGVPSATWNLAEGTSATPIDTASLVSALDSTVFNLTCHCEIGLDLSSDSPADIGRILQGSIGMRFMESLDYVVALGDGTTQPQGIFNASSVGSVPSENDTTGPLTVTDVENMNFGLGKQFRNPAMRPSFVMNDVTYSRARGIAVGASDQRRVFGLTENDYQLLGWPVKINNSIPNTKIAFACLAKYRMYRRVGMSVKFETGGKELSSKNLGLLIVRARFAGRLVDPNAAVKMTDAQDAA